LKTELSCAMSRLLVNTIVLECREKGQAPPMLK